MGCQELTFIQAALCSVCCWGTGCSNSVCSLLPHSHVEFAMQRDLPACGTVSAPSVSCPYNLFISLCALGFFLKRKRYVQRKKDAQKQTKTSCSPVVSKTFCGKRNLLWIYKLWVKVVCWQPLKESGEIVLKCFVRSSDKNLWCLWCAEALKAPCTLVLLSLWLFWTASCAAGCFSCFSGKHWE